MGLRMLEMKENHIQGKDLLLRANIGIDLKMIRKIDLKIVNRNEHKLMLMTTDLKVQNIDDHNRLTASSYQKALAKLKISKM